MGTLEILLLGVALAMDAFAVSVTKGLHGRVLCSDMLIIATFFGGFQALMPLVGWAAGKSLTERIDSYDHWVAFVLLAFIGCKGLLDALREPGADRADSICRGDDRAEPICCGADCADRAKLNFTGLKYAELFALAVATSIDALAVGVTFAMMPSVNVPFAVAVIGSITFLISCFGVVVGRRCGSRYRRKASIAGGLILIAVGVRILMDGLGIFT